MKSQIKFMLSELMSDCMIPSQCRGWLLSSYLYRPAISCIFTCEGHLDFENSGEREPMRCKLTNKCPSQSARNTRRVGIVKYYPPPWSFSRFSHVFSLVAEFPPYSPQPFTFHNHHKQQKP